MGQKDGYSPWGVLLQNKLSIAQNEPPATRCHSQTHVGPFIRSQIICLFS